jgi:Ca2+-binding RTX toxin-like protein
MTTYLYSEIDDGDALAFDPLNDTFIVDKPTIDSPTYSAAEFTLTAQAGGVLWSNGSVSFTFVGVDLSELSQDNVEFANGSMLVNSSDANGHATDLGGGAMDDQLLGSTSNGSPGWTLRGGAGDDVYQISNAADVIVETADQGTDTIRTSVSYTLPTNVERLILTGTAAINATGNALDNEIYGNSAANIIDGRTGEDTLAGGAGDDVYIVASGSALVREKAGEGHDTVRTSDSFLLLDNVEDVILVGTNSSNLWGNAQANYIQGNAMDNRLDGSWGADTLAGGNGDDEYDVDDNADVVVESSGQGTDTVYSAAHDFTLPANVENLVIAYYGSNNGKGNSGNNTITGNEGDNVLDGGGGIDTLNYAVNYYSVTVDLSITTAQDTGAGRDTLLNFENLVGTYSPDTLKGNAAANIIDGFNGADTMAGAAGDDTYLVDNVGDKTVELAAGGTDLVQSSISFALQAEIEKLTLTGTAAINGIGNSLANTITGNSAANAIDGGAGNDVLNGLAGADTLTGSAGNDTFIVDNAGDKTIELAGGGTDFVQSSISFTLQADVENLTLTGTGATRGNGNMLANTITGNNAANVIDGSAGADTMVGGGGDDLYVVDNVGDKTVEVASGGTDRVHSSVTFTLQADVEKLTLTGSSAINGTGNALANALTGNSAANALDGGAGSDTLDGAAGADKLIGGAGDDTYVVDSAADKTIEVASGGVDLVQSSVSLALQAEIEKLTLTGTAAINGIGNSLANTLTGNGAGNVLNGGAGADTLTGGGGADTFAFTSSLASDLITDFAHGVDKIRIGQAAIRVGDGDMVVDGGVAVAGPNGFASSAELVIVTHDISGGITATSAAAAIGHASSAYAVGDTRLFVVDNGSDSAVYLFESADANATISASELTLLATLDNTASTSVGDYLFGA